MRVGLGGKLLGITLGLLSLLTAGALLTVRHEFGQQLRRQAQREIRAGSHVLSSILERSGAQLLDRGRVLADLPSLQTALQKDPRQLEPLLIEVKAIRAANLLWATDPQGKVLACTGEYPPLGESLAPQPLVSAALNGQETLGFDLFGGQWWLMLSLPVRNTLPPVKAAKGKSAPAPNAVLGTVSLTLLIGEAYLNRLSELMGCQVGFIWGEHQIWSAGWPEEAHVAINPQTVRVLTGQPQELIFPGGRYLWLARPVTGGTPPIAAGPIALLGIRLDESVIQRTTRSIGWIALLTMTIGTFLSFWAIRSVTRPLKALVADSQRIGAGDLTHRSQIQGNDEIADLAHSFNEMLGQLQASYSQLSELNRTLEERVKERTRQLEEAQAQLLQAEKLASIGQLAAGVAHELNNPLMVIMGNTQMAIRMLNQSKKIPSEAVLEFKELLEALDKETQRSKMIVNNLLDFARIKPPALVETDIRTLLDESLKLVEHQASLQSVQVVKRYQKDLPLPKVDPGQIKQVFVNVIINAVQAMPLGGTLTLEAAATEQNLTVAVRDSGVGIPPEELERVFDPFFTTKPVGGGTGLGLSLSHTMIQRHKGTIRMESKVGQGTSVLITLPRS